MGNTAGNIQVQEQKKMDVQQIGDSQIFLESIDDIFGTIEGHLKFIKKYQKKKDHIVFDRYDDKYFNNEMLNRIDSLVTVLKIFGIQCYELKHKNGNENALLLGQKNINAKLKELRYTLDSDTYKVYETYARALVYMLKGNKMHFKKRDEVKTETKDEITQKDMSNVMSQVIGGQCKTYKKIDQYRRKNVAKKLNEQHIKQMNQNYPNGLNHETTIPETNELYQVFGITNQTLFIFNFIYIYLFILDLYIYISRFNDIVPDISKDGKDTITLPCNGLVTQCVTDNCINIKFPFPCQLLQDPFNTNDDKALVQLAYPHENVKLRPFKKNIKFHHKTRSNDMNAVISQEYDHIVMYGKLGYQTIVPENGKEAKKDHKKKIEQQKIDKQRKSEQKKKCTQTVGATLMSIIELPSHMICP